MGVQAVLIAKGVIAPQSLAQGVHGHDPAITAGEGFQKGMLLCGQRKNPAGFVDLGPAKINGTALQLYQWRVFLIAPAQKTAQMRNSSSCGRNGFAI